MKKIAFIGAGSIAFARRVVNDLLFLEAFKDAEIRLMDIDPSRLAFAENTMHLVNEKRGANATFIATTDRLEALDGADFVISTIQVGGDAATQVDFDACRRHGLKLVIGDSMGIPGISRAVRTIPVMLDICRDMEKVCPNAYLLNYTNPMGMLLAAILRGSSIQSVGLCHGVFGTAHKMARFIDAPFDQVNYLCAGINHMAFFLKFEVNGQDAYPRLREASVTDAPRPRRVRRGSRRLHHPGQALRRVRRQHLQRHRDRRTLLLQRQHSEPRPDLQPAREHLRRSALPGGQERHPAHPPHPHS